MVSTGDYTLNDYATVIHGTAAAHGFWEKPRNFSEMLMLAVSELSEAQEADRDGQPPVWYEHQGECPWAKYSDSSHVLVGQGAKSNDGLDECSCTPKPEGAAVEVIDAIIRCLDTVRGNWPDIDIDELMYQKMRYNDSRPFKHGRAY